MKKTMLGILAISAIVTSCVKEEVKVTETSAQENAIENTRRCDCSTTTLTLGSSGENWWNLYKLAQGYLVEGSSVPPGEPDYLSEYVEVYQAELVPVFGEERMSKLIDGTWTIRSEGELSLESVFIMNFVSNGSTVDIMNVLSIVGGDDSEDDDGGGGG